MKYELCDRSVVAALTFAGLAVIYLFVPLVATESWLLPYRTTAVLIVFSNSIRWWQARKILARPIEQITKPFRLHSILVIANAVLQGMLFSMVLADPKVPTATVMVSFLIIMGVVAGSTSSIAYVPSLQRWHIFFQMMIPISILAYVHFGESPIMKFMPVIAIVYVVYIIANSRQFYFSMASRFETEEALRIEKENLERAIRDLKKAQEEVLRQKALAEYSSKMASIGQMAGGVAHEINTPLSTILLTAEMLASENPNSPEAATLFHQGLEKIQTTTKRIAQIIRGLLILSRDGTKEPFQKFSLKSAFENTLSVSRKKFQQAEIDFQLAEIPEVQLNGREVQISQVLLNLLNNAFDAVFGTPQAWIRIDFKDLGNFVEISVQNSGPQIPPALQEEIFNPFFTTKAVGKGTGLGLSISRGIVEDHGGELVIDTTAASPRFVFLLPKELSI